jgi:hypothetical protein
MKKVKINRATWACGKRLSKGENRDEANLLFNPTTKGMCCLGFATNQLCKLSEDDLDGKAFPRYFTWYREYNISPQKLCDMFGIANFDILREFEGEAVRINDDSKLSTARREKQILKLFKKYNIDVEFYGEYSQSVKKS